MATGKNLKKRAKTNAKREGAGLYEGTHCQCCGSALPPRTSKRGRPRIYCDPDCQKLDSVLGWAEQIMDQKMDAFTDNAATAMKGRLFGMANSWFWERKRRADKAAK